MIKRTTSQILDKIEYEANRLAGFSIKKLVKDLPETKKIYLISSELEKSAINEEFCFLVSKHGVLVVNERVNTTFDISPKDLIDVNVSLEEALSFNFFKDINRYGNEINLRKESVLKEFNSEVDGLFLQPRNGIKMFNLFFDKGYFAVNNNFIRTNKRLNTQNFLESMYPDSYEDVIMYLPIDWVRYSGYNEQFVMKYLSFLEQVFNESILYEGVVGAPNEFILEKYVDFKRGQYLTSPSFYKVRIQNVQVPIISRYIMMFVSYLYISEHNNIPGLLFRILEQIPRINPLCLLLFAHFGRYYTNGFGLVNSIRLSDSEFSTIHFPSLKDFNVGKTFKNIYKTGEISTDKVLKLSNDEVEGLQKLFNESKFKEAYDSVIQTEEFDNPLLRLAEKPKIKKTLNKKSSFISLDSDPIPSSSNIKASYPKMEWGQIDYGSVGHITLDDIGGFFDDKASEMKKEEIKEQLLNKVKSQQPKPATLPKRHYPKPNNLHRFKLK